MLGQGKSILTELCVSLVWRNERALEVQSGLYKKKEKVMKNLERLKLNGIDL